MALHEKTKNAPLILNDFFEKKINGNEKSMA
jgi:hypothetical protein